MIFFTNTDLMNLQEISKPITREEVVQEMILYLEMPGRKFRSTQPKQCKFCYTCRWRKSQDANVFMGHSAVTMIVNTPPAIAGGKTAIESQFSTQNKLIDVGPVTGDVVYYNDNAGGTTHEAWRRSILQIPLPVKLH
jgi:hypothetical protein